MATGARPRLVTPAVDLRHADALLFQHLLEAHFVIERELQHRVGALAAQCPTPSTKGSSPTDQVPVYHGRSTVLYDADDSGVGVDLDERAIENVGGCAPSTDHGR